VPRIALTKVWKRLHTKLMYNEAFKIPQSITVAAAEAAGQPLAGAEDTRTVEWELGYRLNDAWYLQGNLYWSKIQDYIAYDPFAVATVTAGDISTYGGEFQLQLRQNRWSADLSYSLFMLDDSNIDTLTVAADNHAVLGIPNHKLSLNLGYKLDDGASLNLTAILVGGRYACVSDPEKWLCGEPQKLDTETDLTVFYRQAHKHWHYGIGIANLLDTDVRYAQPYRGGGAPIPGLGRRLMVNVGYRF
jgi:outer membrane receptor protein involved in Fe transport